MQEQTTPAGIQEPDQVEQAVFMLLVVRDEQRPWSVREVELEIGDTAGVADSLAHLRGAGLIHRCGEFVWATRAALHADALGL
jgi:hypothetical protein